MIFAIGTKVRFKHTGDEGVITANLGNDMVEVFIEEDDMKIPTFVDDLENASSFYQKDKKSGTKIVPGKQKKVVQAPERPPIESQYEILKSIGIQIAFEPIYKEDGLPDKYNIYLLNDTRTDYLFQYLFKLNHQEEEKSNGKLLRMSALPVGKLWYDELSDFPEIELEVWKIKTNGTGDKQHKTLKIKPKQFFQKIKTAPILNQRVHLYTFFGVDEPIKKEKKEDLQSYTRRNLRPANNSPAFVRYQVHDVREFAAFNPEIDLHIESLLNKSIAKMRKSEILRIQLVHFENYLDKAIRLGVSHVFIIHGIGKGKLRDEIATRLMFHSDVKSFKNEYHPKYGWGATEVIF